MSKKLLLFATLIIVVGLAIGFYFTHFDPISSIQTAINNPASIIQWIKGIPLTAWVSLVSVCGGIISTVLILASKIKQYTQQTEENVATIKGTYTEALNKESTARTAAETELKKTTLTYSSDLKEISGNYMEIQDKLEEATLANKQLATERDYYYNEWKKLQEKLNQPQRIA